MPIPFHCHECDAPTPNRDGLCGECRRQINAVNSNNTGEKMDHLQSVKQENDKRSKTTSEEDE